MNDHAPDRAAIAAELRAAGVDHADALAALATPSLRLLARRAPTESLPLGASRFNGSADVPRPRIRRAQTMTAMPRFRAIAAIG